MLTKKEKLKHLMADVLYDALFNGKDYDEELLEIYGEWFREDKNEFETWDEILGEIEDTINEICDLEPEEE